MEGQGFIYFIKSMISKPLPPTPPKNNDNQSTNENEATALLTYDKAHQSLKID